MTAAKRKGEAGLVLYHTMSSIILYPANRRVIFCFVSLSIVVSGATGDRLHRGGCATQFKCEEIYQGR